MKKLTDFFNDLFDFDHWPKPWQSITIVTASIMIFVGAIISICIFVK